MTTTTENKAKNFTIGTDRYVIFPNKPKSQPAAEGKGA
jgi:hypothetical protein